jgi:hypothetical protein
LAGTISEVSQTTPQTSFQFTAERIHMSSRTTKSAIVRPIGSRSGGQGANIQRGTPRLVADSVRDASSLVLAALGFGGLIVWGWRRRKLLAITPIARRIGSGHEARANCRRLQTLARSLAAH